MRVDRLARQWNETSGGAKMLEHLNSREFEEYCQLLLTSHYQCKVVLTKQTGDEGRDLLIYHSSGLEVVERNVSTTLRPIFFKSTKIMEGRMVC